MTWLRMTLAAVVAVTMFGAVQPAQAQGFSLRLGGPHFGFSIDRHDHDYRHWRHGGHHNYGWRYGQPRVSRCDSWNRRCADDDYGDYRRCMRRHGCR